MATANNKNTRPARQEVVDELDDDEVRTVTFPFEIGAREVEITCIADINEADPEAYLAYNRKDYPEMMKWLIGEFQWNMLRQMGLRTKHIAGLFGAWAEATGAGED